MLTIRLKRVGQKNDPSFRVVLIESKRGPQSGKINEYLGSYDARKKRVEIKRDRVDYWLSKGVKTSQTVASLLRRNTPTP